MTYASVMVPVDLDPSTADRIRVAAHLADRMDAFLIGTAAQQPFIPTHPEGMIADAALIEGEQQRVDQELAQLERLFRDQLGSRNKVLWRTSLQDAASFVREQARAADIVVLSRQGRDDPSDWRFSVRPGDVVLELGRPILVVPPGLRTVDARRVIIAWKDTREARRAVWDALPILKGAEEVLVAVVTKDPDREAPADVCEYLIRHGVHARTSLRGAQADSSVADELIRIAEHVEADLIVSGAYGHTRVREWVFGGVTRDLLDHSPVCCLMAH